MWLAKRTNFLHWPQPLLYCNTLYCTILYCISLSPAVTHCDFIIIVAAASDDTITNWTISYDTVLYCISKVYHNVPSPFIHLLPHCIAIIMLHIEKSRSGGLVVVCCFYPDVKKAWAWDEITPAAHNLINVHRPARCTSISHQSHCVVSYHGGCPLTFTSHVTRLLCSATDLGQQVCLCLWCLMSKFRFLNRTSVEWKVCFIKHIKLLVSADVKMVCSLTVNACVTFIIGFTLE